MRQLTRLSLLDSVSSGVANWISWKTNGQNLLSEPEGGVHILSSSKQVWESERGFGLSKGPRGSALSLWKRVQLKEPADQDGKEEQIATFQLLLPWKTKALILARGRSGRKWCDFLLNWNFPLSYERVLFLQVQPLADVPSSRVQGRGGRGWDTVGISQPAYAGGHALASSPTGFPYSVNPR